MCFYRSISYTFHEVNVEAECIWEKMLGQDENKDKENYDINSNKETNTIEFPKEYK